jgi:RND superfamily putative drug exporter
MAAARTTGRRWHWIKWIVVLAWIALLGGLGPLAGKLTGAENNNAASWLPSGAESTRALELSGIFQPTNTFPAIVVYARSSGITAADRSVATAGARAFARVPLVQGAPAGPAESKDGRALETVVNIKLGKDGWNGLPTTVSQLRTILDAGPGATRSGLSSYITGAAGYAAGESTSFSSSNKLLAITGLIVIIILLLTYRSPVLWILPIVTSAIALASAEGLIYLLAAHAGLVVNAESSFVLIVLVIGAVTDYSLLLIARYREELGRHADRHEAMAVALRRAGPAIVASGLTVAAGMLCLLAAGLNSTKGLGPLCAIGVGVGLVAAVTLLPALLMIFGRWIFWPRAPRYDRAKQPVTAGPWARVGQAISRRPRITWIGTVIVLAALASGIVALHASGLQNKDGFWGTQPSSVTGESVADAHFPAGAGSPIQVIGNARQAAGMRTALAATPGVSGVASPVIKDGYAYLAGTTTKASDDPAAYSIVEHARANLHAVPGAHAVVGGDAAVNLDIETAAQHDRGVVIPLVLGVVFLILVLLLRALVAPLLLMGTVVLSFGATLGVSALVFDHLFHFVGGDPELPLWVFVFLVALGVDYNIFLMTRIREESRSGGTRRGAIAGLAATGGVITSAGFVLASTFAALGSLHLVFITEVGFAVAFGVLLDTLIVRTVLVTALTLDVGRWMWWPSALSRPLGAAPAAIAGPPPGPTPAARST